MNYLNVKGIDGIETVEDISELTKAEKWDLLKNYRISDPSNHYYLSSRSTKEFKER